MRRRSARINSAVARRQVSVWTDPDTRLAAYRLAGRTTGPGAVLDHVASCLARFRRVRVAREGRGPEGPHATIYGYGMLLLRSPTLPVPER